MMIEVRWRWSQKGHTVRAFADTRRSYYSFGEKPAETPVFILIILVLTEPFQKMQSAEDANGSRKSFIGNVSISNCAITRSRYTKVCL